SEVVLPLSGTRARSAVAGVADAAATTTRQAAGRTFPRPVCDSWLAARGARLWPGKHALAVTRVQLRLADETLRATACLLAYWIVLTKTDRLASVQYGAILPGCPDIPEPMRS